MQGKTIGKTSSKETEKFINILKLRFNENISRHKDIKWTDVEKKLRKSETKIFSLNEMEKTGGEPDVVGYIKENDEYIFFDCSPETPEGRRNLCYDDSALESRKKNKPAGSAIGMAQSMGIDILSEEDYRMLQTLGEFDNKTSSWVKTPDEIRILGGAVFCDRRYNHVFLYHNGAESYYSVRGFRGSLKV